MGLPEVSYLGQGGANASTGGTGAVPGLGMGAFG